MDDLRVTQVDMPPGLIDLGSGQPEPGLLPLALMEQAAIHRLGQGNASLLAYGYEQGDGYFRIALAKFLSMQYGMPVDERQLFVTAGASLGLHLICALFSRPGDIIFVEEPTYFLALRIFADHGLQVMRLPMDENGLIIEALEEKLAVHKPVFVYTIPSFHNPASLTLPAARREKLVRLSREHEFLIVADEVYHLLSYGGVLPPPLGCFADDGTILSLGSFSKILAPGLRLGWIQAAPVLLQRFVKSGLLDSGGGLNPFTSALVHSAIELGLQQEHLEHLKKVYAHRMICLGAALREYLPASVRFKQPQGGFFIWLRFARGVDTEKLLAAVRPYDVAFQPGANFSSGQGVRHCARLGISYFEADQLEEGAKRLATAVKNYPGIS
jgi:DNA-binding transcriptional MocR family regulator